MPKTTTSAAAWKTAARIAWYDTRKNLVSTVLALLIIIIPATTLIAFTAWDEASLSSSKLREAAEFSDALGSLGYSPRIMYGTQGDATQVTPSVPGDKDGANFQEVTTALEHFTGLNLVAFDVDTPGGRPIARTTATSDLPGKATLISGRWPSTPSEMMVTQAGIDAGLPTSGTAALSDGRAYTVVGVGSAIDSAHSPPLPAHAVTQPNDATSIEQWLIVGDPTNALANSAIRDSWGGYNLTLNTPSPAFLSAKWFRDVVFEDSVRTGLFAMAFVAFLIVMVLTVVGLVISPAFTIRAARLSEHLHNLARNGATTNHLRSVVIVQGLVQGLVATAVSIGISLAYVAVRGLTTPAAALPYGEVDYRAVLWPCALLGSAIVVCSLVASLVPALNITKSGKLDASGAEHTPRMRDDFLGLSARASLRLSTTLLIVGSLGICVTIYAAVQFGMNRYPIYPVFIIGIVAASACAASILAGLIYFVPVALSWLSTKTSFLPCSPRQSLRILTRTKGPSTAIILSVTVITAITGSIALLNTWVATQNDRSTHSVLPQKGEELIVVGAQLGKYDDLMSDAFSANGFTYHKTYTPILFAHDLDGDSPPPAPGTMPTSYDNLLAPSTWPRAAETMSSPLDTEWDTTNVVVPRWSSGAQALILDEDTLTERFAFSAEELEALRTGSMFAYGKNQPKETPGTLTLHRKDSAPTTIPLRAAPHTTEGNAPDTSHGIVYFGSKSGMEQLGITVHPHGWLLTSHNGSPMSSKNYSHAYDVLRKVSDTRVDFSAYASWDTGRTTEDTSLYRSTPVHVIAGILVLLILTMTILSTYESRTAQRTISALGGPTTHARNYVGVGAFTTSAFGTTIGFLASLIVVLPATFTLHLIGHPIADVSAWAATLAGLAVIFVVAVPLASTALAWLLSPVVTSKQ